MKHRMLRRMISGLLAAPVVLMLVETSVLAHHSFAMFDFSKLVSLRATVKEFQWTNPHVILWITTEPKEKDEKPQVWSIELTSPGNLTRVGWSKRSFKAGDRIDLDLHPLRDGARGGAFKKATILVTGQVLTSDLRAQEKPGLQ